MNRMHLAAAATAVLMAGCAASPELITCLQPERRVVVEVGGTKIKPPPKNKPNAKPGKQTVVLKGVIQGDLAWDHGSAMLKDGGKAEVDKLIKLVNQGSRRDKRPTKISSLVITGHIDPVEFDDGLTTLDEQRAKSVMAYMVSKGIDGNLMLVDGRDAKDPMPVTKFCGI